MKNELSRLLRRRPKRRKGDIRELAARLAPLEEQEPREAKSSSAGIQKDGAALATQEIGAIVVGNQRPQLPKDIVDVESRKRFLDLEPVVLVIVGLMLVFIVFIAWQIARM